jgi:chromatin assembly factor 1 subunit A
VKFLLFDPKEYRRPPYYGTWRKRSKNINGRKPFAKDADVFDYDVDSDEEWEDEPDGESIASSKCDDEDDVLDDDEEDDGFFVPHGHLSDDEIDEENRIVSLSSLILSFKCVYL